MSQPHIVYITRPDPSKEWGFRIHGGRDTGEALVITYVVSGSLADRHGVQAGDRVLGIGGDAADGMTHQQAQQAVIRCGNELELAVLPGDGYSSLPRRTAPPPVQHSSTPAYAGTLSPVGGSRNHGSFFAGHEDAGLVSGAGYVSNPAGPNFRSQKVVHVGGNRSGGRPAHSFPSHNDAQPIYGSSSPPVSPCRAPTASNRAPGGGGGGGGRFGSPLGFSGHNAVPSPLINGGRGGGGGVAPSGPPANQRSAPIRPLNAGLAHTAPKPASPRPFREANNNNNNRQAPGPQAHRQPPTTGGGGGGQEPRRVRAGAANLRQQGAGEVPICAVCRSAIRGAFVAALSFTYCPEHFCCSHCKASLEGRDFVEEAGQLYCEDDFARLLAPRCSKCSEPVVGLVVTAMRRQWHPHCFMCHQCRQPLSETTFRVGEDNQPYCEADWRQLFGVTCVACQQLIDGADRFLEALGKTYHADCFKCAACQVSLDGKPFVPRDGKAFCKAHARAAAIF